MLFLFVGNSGSGKDTVMQQLAKKIDVVIVKRYITRLPSPETEDFYSISKEDFEKRKEDFFVWWESYDNFYGIDNNIVDELKMGKTVVANVSRDVIDKIKEKWPQTKVIFISVPLETTIKRLNGRDRDKHTATHRIERAKLNVGKEKADFVVENNGELNKTCEEIVEFIKNENKK